MNQEKFKDIEPEIIFSLYMFLKNYKYLESPDQIFKYIQDQYTFIKNKIQEIE